MHLSRVVMHVSPHINPYSVLRCASPSRDTHCRLQYSEGTIKEQCDFEYMWKSMVAGTLLGALDTDFNCFGVWPCLFRTHVNPHCVLRSVSPPIDTHCRLQNLEEPAEEHYELSRVTNKTNIFQASRSTLLHGNEQRL